jgi:integrase
MQQLPSGALRVRVYGGIDPVSKRRLDLRETVPPGPRARAEAEKVLTRLLNQVDEKRNPRTTAPLNQLLDRWLEVLDAEASTRRGYLTKIDKHIRPILGHLPVARVDAEVLESFYADLRKCKDHCGGRTFIQHRTQRPHLCDEHAEAPCDPPDPDCRSCQRTCKPHACRPLSDSSIRAIHWILSAAFRRGVRWSWLTVNPTDHAEPPRMPQPNPQPPTADEAARLAKAAFALDPDWGTFVWLAMTSGARRSELCALRWSHIDLEQSVLTIRTAMFVNEEGRLDEKDTKTHQQRRVVLDAETIEVLREHRARWMERAKALGIQLSANAYVFSLSPDGSTPPVPNSVTQKYQRMAQRLRVDTTLHRLRHYSATELINTGVDIRTIAGRLGHGGGGATTLRVYAAWLSEADQRAASSLATRMPSQDSRSSVSELVGAAPNSIESSEPASPYQRIADDLRGAIACGALSAGNQLPSVKYLAARYGVAVGTANRAVAQLKADGTVKVSRGRRAIIA